MTITRIIIKGLIFAYLVYLSVIDIKGRRVKNKSLIFLLLPVTVSIVLDVICGSYTALISSVLGGVVGFGVMLLVSLITHNGIGGGDIKLAGLLGLVLGLKGTLLFLLAASFIGSVYGLVKSAVKKDKKVDMPFVPFMTVGYILPAVLTLLH